MNNRTFFATSPKGIEPVLAPELKSLGAANVRIARGGVSFQGTLATAYRVCLWSRTANRILLPLTSFSAPDPETLYREVRAIGWEEHISPNGTLVVDFTATDSQIRHTQFGAQKVKDAIVDRFRERYGQRPSVDRQHPDLRINIYLLRNVATVGLDLSGDSLHRRGYREETVLAPLKENLAAALLLKAGWPEVAAAGGPLLDPMCGSGTLPIEAALMAANIAPGLLRTYWGFLGWRQHDPTVWKTLLTEARRGRANTIKSKPSILGFDQDSQAVRAALANAERAGLQGLVHFERRDLVHTEAPRDSAPGLLIVNPPYGERLGELQELEVLYAHLGEVLKGRLSHWRAAVFTGNPDLGKRMGLRAQRVNAFYNGALPCKLLRFTVEPSWFVERETADARKQAALIRDAEMFANRLQKNLRTVGRWAKREGITCYRLYDADIPEYAVAVDVYEDWVHVQEYEAPRSVEPRRAQERLEQAIAVIRVVLERPSERIVLKVRKRQRGFNQYEKQAAGGRFFEVREGSCRLLVNLTDYLDTGLFLDHRLTRQMIGGLARGRRFLNLFAYTGTASVYAALNGARTTTSVDMSQTYLAWARRNLALNGIIDPRHTLVQADCLEWLEQNRYRYDLIFLDPPTFSNSKRMQKSFDVQRDHVELIRKTMARLDQDGLLIFSNNCRHFKLDKQALKDLRIDDVTRQTLPKDFERNPKIHNCWQITR